MVKFKIILGTSLTAKIFAFYNREFKMIGKNNSLTKTGFLKNLIFLQDNFYNRMFIQDLISISGKEIDYEYKHIDVLTFDEKIGYKKEISKEEKLSILQKKLTDQDGNKLEFKSNVFQEEIRLSEETNGDLKIIEVDFDKINEVLDEVIKSQILDETEITEIDFNKKIIKTQKSEEFNDCYEYQELVNTLSLKKISKISNLNISDLNTLDTTVIEGDEKFFGIEKIPYANSIVYFPQDKFEFGKVIKRSGRCYAEITGKSKKFPGGELSKDARLIKKNFILPYDNVIMLGRFAEWDADSKIQDIVRKSSNKFVMQNIWANQKAFSSRFFDMQEDLTIMQNNAKEITLLLINELYDFLNTLNWKKHEKERKIDSEKMKEELIDVQKYLLSLMINMGVSFEDFVDAYYKKNEKLKIKFNELNNKKEV